VNNFDATLVSSFNVDSDTLKLIGDYSQMVWANSDTLSCGISSCHDLSISPNRWIVTVVCNYLPAGNVLTEPIYLQGEPCSSCLTECNADYFGIN
jgi:hypothetical protein